MKYDVHYVKPEKTPSQKGGARAERRKAERMNRRKEKRKARRSS